MSAFEDPKRKLLELQAQRDALEMEAEAIVSELNSPGSKGEPAVGVKGSLVDKDGFPRADVDVYRARTLRHRLAVISTDHKALMKDIESALRDLHASYHLPVYEELEKQRQKELGEAKVAGSAQAIGVGVEALSVSKAKADAPVAGLLDCKAMATVDQILDGSPAQSAGLRDGDRLLAFGNVTSSAYSDPLVEVVAVVKECYGQMSAGCGTVGSMHIPVVVQRGQEQLQLKLVPATWAGRGLLGCHLSPILE
jgi:26S proteasome regulatory subunit N4